MSTTKHTDQAWKAFETDALSTDRKWFRSGLEVPAAGSLAAGVCRVAGYLLLGLGGWKQPLPQSPQCSNQLP